MKYLNLNCVNLAVGSMDKPYLLSQLEYFYKLLEVTTSQLEGKHANKLQCKMGCSACCVDGITVFSIEAENIRQKELQVLNTAKPGQIGQCAFLGTNSECTIYETRPYVCRTQGLPLRWIEALNTEIFVHSMRRVNLCLKFQPKTALHSKILKKNWPFCKFNLMEAKCKG
jgi:Fe-S-cluster containining protein